MQQRNRIVRRVVVLVAVVATVGATVAVRPWEPDSAAETDDVAPAVVPAEAVTVGDLTTTVSLDGSVTFAGTTAVVHRIDGEVATASAPVSASATNGASSNDGSSSASPVPLAVTSADCATPPVSETTTTAAGPVPPAPAAPAETTTTTDPGPTTSTDTTTTTPPTTTVAPVTSAATAPPTTQACDDSTTTTVDPTTVSAPSVVAPPGGAPSGGAAPGMVGTSNAPGSGSSATRATQIVTSVRPAGSTADLGDVLYTVDGSPVVVMRGWFPAWRTLSTASDDGVDVAQLEDSLVALGYDPDGAMTVDEEFDADTEAAVERWQEGLGLEATGEVALGSVVFLSSDSTISAVSVEVGDEIGDGDVVAELATPSQQVVIDVPTEDQPLVAVGTSVEVGGVGGSVTRLRSVAGDSGVGVQAVITPVTAIADAAEGAVVKVRFTSVTATSVLLVPVEAVASRLDASYAVQVVENGMTRWVTVEIVGAAGQDVGITGDGITEGDEVAVPA